MKVCSLDEFLKIIHSLSNNHSIYVWGTGVYGNLVGKLFNDNNIYWDGYYDNYSYEKLLQLNGKKIYSGQKLFFTNNILFILSMRNYNLVMDQLINAGYKDNNIICFDNVKFFNELGDKYTINSQHFKQMKLFQNIHKNKRCFIIGNGPSLTLKDLTLIHNNHDISFASNMIFKCYADTKWRPNYYFFVDPNGIKETFTNYDTLKYVSENCSYMFSRNNGELQEIAQNINNLCLFKSVFSANEVNYLFSSDCSDKLYIGYTVTYAMLQVAVYMGFSELYLLGVDHNYSNEIKNDGSLVVNNVNDHSNILGAAKSSYYNIDKTTLAYIAAKKYADEHGIKIYNATRGGKLEVFPRVDFDSLF